MSINSKRTGDIAEQFLILEALRNNYEVLKPIGDRLPYDLVLTKDNRFVRIQVKTAWYNEPKNGWIVTTSRTRFGKNKCHRDPYKIGDFDYAAIYVPLNNNVYLIPIAIFTSYNNHMTVPDGIKIKKCGNQPKHDLTVFCNNWNI